MTTQMDPITSTAKCPRCGYDLRGAIDTWEEQCPLTGICTECGLEVKWAEVLHPEKFEPQWCVEFTPYGKRILISCGKTFLRSFWPFRFWSMLKMSLDIRWGRIAIYLAALLLPILLGYVCVQSAMAILVRSYLQGQVAQRTAQVQNQIAGLNSNRPLIILRNKARYEASKTILEGFLASHTLNLRQQSFIDANQTWIEAVEEQGVDAWAQQEVQSELQLLQQSLTSISINHSYLAAVAEAVFLPWRDKSLGTLGPGLGMFYPAPSRLIRYIKGRNNFNAFPTSNNDREVFLKTLTITSMAFWTCLLFPLTFIFLPISRKRAKVRWGHVLRVMCYSVFIPSTVLCIALLAASLGYTFAGAANSWFGLAHFVSRYFMLPMLIIWWAVAIKRYMCIAHGWLTAILLTSMLALAFVGLFWLLFPSGLLKLLLA